MAERGGLKLKYDSIHLLYTQDVYLIVDSRKTYNFCAVGRRWLFYNTWATEEGNYVATIPSVNATIKSSDVLRTNIKASEEQDGSHARHSFCKSRVDEWVESSTTVTVVSFVGLSKPTVRAPKIKAFGCSLWIFPCRRPSNAGRAEDSSLCEACGWECALGQQPEAGSTCQQRLDIQISRNAVYQTSVLTVAPHTCKP